MKEETTIATAAEMLAKDRYLRTAMFALLDRLLEHVHIGVGRDGAAPYWVTGIDSGPEKLILDTLKMFPELWLSAVPDAVVIVTKAHFEKLSSVAGPWLSEIMATEGMNAIQVVAARLRGEHDAKVREADRKRFGPPPLPDSAKE